MQQLVSEDYNILIEALDAWESKDFGTDILDTIFDAMFGKNLPPEDKAALERDTQDRQEKRKLERTARKERSVMLKAKLLQLREEVLHATG